MTAFGQYEDDNSASTLKQRDHKDATDLVVAPSVTSKWAKGSGGPSGDEAQNLVAQMLFVRNGVEVDRHGKKAGKGALIATEEAPTLDAGNHWALFDPQPIDYGVRRLTPVECERLQAFPDGWTEPAVSDSARYKALGNAVTVNTVRWVLGRMLEQS
jgi:DNA (cytosine-5)-methyltransferase 1